MGEKDNILEEDLYEPVKEFFQKQGYKVNGEVRDCDVTAMKDDHLVVVELKKNLSVTLLSQAVKRQKIADEVYIAIPKPSKLRLNGKWKDIFHLLRRLEIGLLMVSLKKDKIFVEQLLEPISFDRIKSVQRNKKGRNNLVKEIEGRYMDLNKGGSKGKKIVTAYRESAIYIACCLNLYGPLSPKKLRTLGSDEKKTLSILSQNHYGWFNKVDRGIYELTEKGLMAFDEYPQLIQYYKEEILKKNRTQQKVEE